MPDARGTSLAVGLDGAAALDDRGRQRLSCVLVQVLDPGRPLDVPMKGMPSLLASVSATVVFFDSGGPPSR